MASKRTVTLPANQFAALSAQANAALAAGVVEDDEEPTEAEQDLAAAERDEEADVFGTLLELQGAREARWQLHRLLPAEKAGFVLEMSSGELTLSNIAKRCGPGKYKVLGINSRGRYVGQKTVQIAPPDMPEGVSVQAPGGVQDMLALMREDRERRKDEAFKWATLLVPTLGPALMQLFGQRGPTLSELTQTLTNMRQLAGGDESQVSKVEELTRLIELAKNLGGGGDATGAGWLDLARDAIKEGGPLLQGLLQAAANRSRPAIPGAVVPQPTPALMRPMPAPGAPPVSAPAAPGVIQPGATHPPETYFATDNEGNPMMRVLMWLKGQVPGLLQKAARNLDPEVYAAVLIDDMPDGTDISAVRDYMAREDWFDWVIKFVPQAAQYREWLEELRDALLAEIDAIIAEAQKDVAAPIPGLVAPEVPANE